MTVPPPAPAALPVLVYAAHAGDHLADSTLEALTVGRGLGEPVAVATVPPSPRSLDQLVAAGVDRVLVADLGEEAAALAPAVTQTITAAHARLGGEPHVLIPSSFVGKEIAAQVAYHLDAGLLIDVADIHRTDAGIAGGKRAFAGTWSCECTTTSPRAVVTIRPNAVTAVPADRPGRAEIEALAVIPALPTGLRLDERTVHAGSGRPDLAEAAYVVAGGRGTHGDFGPVEELADVLGGAIGTTRDCVEEGWISHENQIGQTGVTIAPRVYIGAGISGAPHHHGGMQASRTIIVINIDEEAPLVQVADLAIIGDAASVLTEAAEAIREYRAR